MNPKYAMQVEQEIMKMLDAGIIFKVTTNGWVSPIVISLKKNCNLRICVDFWKLNIVTKKGYLPMLFMDSILEEVVGNEVYSFFDGFSEYDQINIVKEDKLKTTFVSKYNIYGYNKIPFELCNAPTTFQWIILNIFKKMFGDNVEVFLDDCMLYSLLNNHLIDLW